MLAALASVIPVGLALGLLAFGRYGEREPPEPRARNVAPVAFGALVLGPVAVSILGLAAWLVSVVIVAATILMVAMLRTPPLRN